ncbi:MAG TPA: ABC transporter permease [Candidatus Nanopelagicales bacterium]|nr:ABC transporter permease [Candidatus Nanopelagicales bacterium]
MNATLRNIRAVARREFLVRARTRSFVIGTLFLAVAGAALALAPIGIRWFEGDVGTKVGVVNRADPALTADPVTRLSLLLNASTPSGEKGFEVSASADEAAARAAVEDGDLDAALVIERDPGPDLTFIVISKDPPGRRTPELLRQASYSLAIADRLDRLGVAPGDQATLFAPPEVAVQTPTPAGPDEPSSGAEMAATAIVGQVLIIFLLLAVILYGQWVAMSVAEEKSSRVMEIIISAATPFQLLGGKVLGVGGLGIVQLLAAAVPALVAFVLQGRIAEIVLGAPPSDLELPQVLTAGVAGAFLVFFVLGYLLYAVLYAAAGSLVSRMEDVNNVVAPMSLIGTLGYLVAIYVSMGLLPADATWVAVLSYVPFISPYLMVSRVIAGQAGLPEVALAAAILVVSIVVLLWLAARVYAAGVLMYGQSPSFRRLIVTAFGRRG